VRLKPVYVLAVIVVIAALATWITLPSDFLNVAGAKDGVTVHRGLDLEGGLQVVLEARPAPGQNVDRDVLNGTRDTISRRVSGLGVSEPLIQTRGNNQIVVELPGVKDPQAAVNLLKATALLEIIDPAGQLLPVGTKVNTTLGTIDSVNANGTPGTPGATRPADASPEGSVTPDATPNATPGASATPEVTGPTYTTIVAGDDISDAFPTTDQFGTLVVGFKLKDSAASKFYEYTSTHIGQPMSIVLDKEVINSATIQDAISNQGIINGLSAQEVSDLAIQIKSGALGVPLEVVQSRTVGPTLGQDSIDKSVEAGIVGITLVALMMILYYRLPGVLSVVALLIYSAIVMALFKLIPVTLTLAGIAGFVLSIGMAVDANVLIFARLKDELRMGRTIPNAVEAGFQHAWPSIRDSNVSTMITCSILYWFGRYVGASIIQGFALTLFIGVVVSMFTAIIVTRTLLRVILTIRPITNRWWLGVSSRQPGASVGD
jgi:preprotein translocase subunit SecD